MATRPRELELVTPRKRMGMFIPAGVKGRVTARYQVQIGKDEILECVRVHFYHGAGYTLHFSESQFKLLLKGYKEAGGG